MTTAHQLELINGDVVSFSEEIVDLMGKGILGMVGWTPEVIRENGNQWKVVGGAGTENIRLSPLVDGLLVESIVWRITPDEDVLA